MSFWYYEEWTENTRFGIKCIREILKTKSEYQDIVFYEAEEWGKFFTLDGLMMVTEKDEFIYHDMITHIPFAVNPSIKKVLVIGAGDGGTVREVARYKQVEIIDVVEIDKEVINLSKKYLPQTACGFDDKRVNIVIADGVEFVRNAQDGMYDLILVDSTDPIGPGEGLFTNDFYSNCNRILNETGILINQHESPYFDEYACEMKRAHRRIKDNFPIAKVYQFHQAIYPSGHWLFGFASKKYDPIVDHKPEIWEDFGIKTKYYNSDLHKGCFALPTYVKESLGE